MSTVVVPLNTFLPPLSDFYPRVCGPAGDLGWRMVTRCSVQDEGTGPATHTLYIDTTPGTWTPQSDTTHTLDKVGILTILTIFLGQITSGDLK